MSMSQLPFFYPEYPDDFHYVVNYPQMKLCGYSESNCPLGYQEVIICVVVFEVVGECHRVPVLHACLHELLYIIHVEECIGVGDSNEIFQRIHKEDLPRIRKAYQNLVDQPVNYIKEEFESTMFCPRFSSKELWKFMWLNTPPESQNIKTSTKLNAYRDHDVLVRNMPIAYGHATVHIKP